MNKFKRTLVAVFVVLGLLAAVLCAVGCHVGSDPDAQTPETPKSAYSVSVDVNDETLGGYSLSAAPSDGKYPEGTPVTITVAPREGYEATLTVNGQAVELVDNAYTFQISANTIVLVDYAYRYTVSAHVYTGKAEVTFSAPSDGILYRENEEVTVTVKPEEGYTVGSVKLNSAEQTLAFDAKNGTYSFKFNIKGKSYVAVSCVEACNVFILNDDEKGALTIDGSPVANGTTLTAKAGDTLSLSVAPKGGNTVKALYADGAYVPLEGNAATVTVKKAMELKVVYNTFYTVTLPAAETLKNGALSLDRQPSVLGYEEGTVLVLSVTPEEGYTLRSLTVTVDGVTSDITEIAARGTYSFRVEGNISFAAVFSAPKVSVSYNNALFGTAVLSGADAIDGTYPCGSLLTVTVTPNNGFAFNYLSLNGVRAAAEPRDEEGAFVYTFAVEGDTELYVNFKVVDRYRVTLSQDGLGDYGITATLGDYLGYNGEVITVGIAGGELPAGKGLFYTAGGEKRLVAGESFTAVIAGENLRIAVFVADLMQPTVTFTEGTYDYDVVLSGADYVITLHDPADRGEERFTQWIVTLGGKNVTLTADAEAGTHSFTVPYSEAAGAMEIRITANWGDLFSLKFLSDPNGSVSLSDGYRKAGNVTFTVTPNEGYRVKSVAVLSDGGTTLKTSAFNVLGAVTETFSLTLDTTVQVTYQKIFTVAFGLTDSDGDSATFEVTVPAGAFRVGSAANIWTLDEGSAYALKVTAHADHNVRSVKVGGKELVTASANIFTSENMTLSSDVRVEVKTVALFAVRWSVIGPADVAVKNGEVALASGDKVEKGSRLTLTPALKTGTAGDYVFTVTANGQSVDAASGVYNIDVTAATEIAVTAAKKLGVAFPAPSPTAPSAPSATPTQGAWGSLNTAAGAEDELVFTEHTLFIGADPVKEIETKGEGGAVEYTLKTEGDKTYTLSWFNDTAGYILELGQTAQSAARLSARIGEPITRYYLNPDLAEERLHAAPEDALNGTWKAGSSELTLGSSDGRMTLRFGNTSANYIIKASDTLYFVIFDGGLPYVMTCENNALTFGGTAYAKQTEERERKITEAYGAELFGEQDVSFAVCVKYTGFDETTIGAVKLVLEKDGVKTEIALKTAENGGDHFRLCFDVTATGFGEYTLGLAYNGETAFAGTIAGEGKATAAAKTYTCREGKLIVSEAVAEYAVTVSMTGGGEGCAYTLKKNGAAFDPESDKVTAADTLTLTVEVPENYTVEISLQHCNLAGKEGNVYTISGFGADASIAIAFSQIPQPAPTVAYAVERVSFDGLKLVVEFTATNTAIQDLIGKPKICLSGAEDVLCENVVSNGDIKFRAEFNLETVPVGTYPMAFQIDGTDVPLPDGLDLTGGDIAARSYALRSVDGSCTLTVHVASVISEAYDAALSDDAEIILFVKTTFDLSQLREFRLELTNGETKIDSIRTAVEQRDDGYLFTFTLPSLDVAEYKLALVRDDYSYGAIKGGSEQKSVEVEGGKTYRLVDDRLSVTETIKTFTITVTVQDRPSSVADACYQLTKNGMAVESGSPVPFDAELDLTVSVPEGYSVEVEIDHGSVAAAEGAHTYKVTLKGDATLTIKYHPTLKRTLSGGETVTFTATARGFGSDIDIEINGVLTLHLFGCEWGDEIRDYSSLSENCGGYFVTCYDFPELFSLSAGTEIEITIFLSEKILTVAFNIGGMEYTLSISSFENDVDLVFVPDSLNDPALF